jgi:hypothetical protein
VRARLVERRVAHPRPGEETCGTFVRIPAIALTIALASLAQGRTGQALQGHARLLRLAAGARLTCTAQDVWTLKSFRYELGEKLALDFAARSTTTRSILERTCAPARTLALRRSDHDPDRQRTMSSAESSP